MSVVQQQLVSTGEQLEGRPLDHLGAMCTLLSNIPMPAECPTRSGEHWEEEAEAGSCRRVTELSGDPEADEFMVSFWRVPKVLRKPQQMQAQAQCVQYRSEPAVRERSAV